MTAKELLNKQLEDVSFQIEKVLVGVKESDLDYKVAPTTMSIREIVEHLCEVYLAVEEESKGGSHEWGSFSIADKSWSNLTSEFSAGRAKAVGIVLAGDDDKSLLSGTGYIVAHDCYHLGQLVTLRLATDPSWDAYSIYPH